MAKKCFIKLTSTIFPLYSLFKITNARVQRLSERTIYTVYTVLYINIVHSQQSLPSRSLQCKVHTPHEYIYILNTNLAN